MLVLPHHVQLLIYVMAITMETTLVNHIFQLTATVTVVQLKHACQDLSVCPLTPILQLKVTKCVRKSSVSNLIKISPSSTLQTI